ncbi:MAG: carboxypeptidase-like regulatory domain-containing protein [Candidatus Aenigmarchaeota archaeon]|nr:carboxypeptidase-like regulatory domain-containing protein [Candidatus Aenigmarchaeota archaeon]
MIMRKLSFLLIFFSFFIPLSSALCDNDNPCPPGYLCISNSCVRATTTTVETTTQPSSGSTPRPQPGGGTVTTTTYCVCGYVSSATCPGSDPGSRYFYGNICGSLQCTKCEVCQCSDWVKIGCGKEGCEPNKMAYKRSCYSGRCATIDCRNDIQCTSNVICSWIGNGCCIDGKTKFSLMCNFGEGPKEDDRDCIGICGSCSCTPWQGTGERGNCPIGFEKQIRTCEPKNICKEDTERCVVAVQTPVSQTYNPTVQPPPSTTLPSNNNNPKGFHDSLDCQITTGWSCDPDNYNLPLKIEFYLDGEIGTGTLIGTTTAEETRVDVITQCGGNTNHGFSWQIPTNIKDGNTHNIYVYAVGDKGEKIKLTNSPKTIQCSKSLTISADVIKDGCSQITDANKDKCKKYKDLIRVMRGEKIIVNGYVYSGNDLISGANVQIIIKNSTRQEKFKSNTQTGSNGAFSFTYTINSDYGSWLIELTASKPGYQDGQTTLLFDVVDCFKDDDCPIYAYCSENLKCIDLREFAASCNYFDYCDNGKIPGTQQNCVYGIHCYSKNIPENEMWPLCNDNNYAAHSLIINCKSIGRLG